MPRPAPSKPAEPTHETAENVSEDERAFRERCAAEVAAMTAVPEDDDAAAPGVWHRRWFEPSCKPPHPGAVVPLAVLLLAAELAGERGSIVSSALWPFMQRQVVEQSLPWLRAAGWIALDGSTIRILRTPPRTA